MIEQLLAYLEKYADIMKKKVEKTVSVVDGESKNGT